MSQALYRKYRSRSLGEVLGQDHITSVLSQALKKGRIAHAYLLTGPRGTGKTSVARILAHEINQLPYDEGSTNLDIIEIDAASNNGVDDIRALREKAQIAPTSAKYKVYIIDEVHMLSKPAFNALLKTLEEPPQHVIFILATTDADKLPATILSRVQQYYFRPIPANIIAKHLTDIAKREGFGIDKKAAELIARQSRGGFRDSISLLDQLSSIADKNKPLTEKQVLDSLGLSSDEHIDRLIDAYSKKDSTKLLELLKNLEEDGADPVITTNQLLVSLRERLVKQPSYVELIEKLIEVTKHPHPDLKLLTALLPTTDVQKTPPSNASYVSEPTPALKLDELSSQTVQKGLNSIKPTPAKTSPPGTPQEKPTKPGKDSEGAKKTKSSKKNLGTKLPESFDWTRLLEECKKLSMGLFGTLSGCDFEYQGGTLTLYTGKQFTQKRLDDVKMRPLLSQALENSHGVDIETVISAEGKPPSNKKLASIAELMGGGAEVSLEELS